MIGPHTFDDFKTWLLEQDPDLTYDWFDGKMCPVGRFLADYGYQGFTSEFSELFEGVTVISGPDVEFDAFDAFRARFNQDPREIIYEFLLLNNEGKDVSTKYSSSGGRRGSLMATAQARIKRFEYTGDV